MIKSGVHTILAAAMLAAASQAGAAQPMVSYRALAMSAGG